MTRDISEISKELREALAAKEAENERLQIQIAAAERLAREQRDRARVI